MTKVQLDNLSRLLAQLQFEDDDEINSIHFEVIQGLIEDARENL
jgi:hypothetical protein